MANKTRPIRRQGVDPARREATKPPAVVTQNVVDKTESARRAARPAGPRVLFGDSALREQQQSRATLMPDDILYHRIYLWLYLIGGALLLAFAIWTVVQAANEASGSLDASNWFQAIWPAVVAGIAGFFGVYALTYGLRLWREGPRPGRFVKRARRR